MRVKSFRSLMYFSCLPYP